MNSETMKILDQLSDWCASARASIGAVDGYDYRSGEEFGIRRVQIEIDRLRAVKTAEQ